MIKINLLSPSDKLNLKWEKINRLVMDSFFVLFLIQIVVVAIFLVTLQYLDVENKSLLVNLESLQLRSEAKEITVIKSETKKYEAKIRAYTELEKMHPIWLNVLEDLTSVIPDGIKINNVSIGPSIKITTSSSSRRAKQIENKNYNILAVKIIGESLTMDDLLALEENLKNSKVFSGFAVDPTNYDNKSFQYNLNMEK